MSARRNKPALRVIVAPVLGLNDGILERAGEAGYVPGATAHDYLRCPHAKTGYHTWRNGRRQAEDGREAESRIGVTDVRECRHCTCVRVTYHLGWGAVKGTCFISMAEWNAIMRGALRRQRKYPKAGSPVAIEEAVPAQ